MAESKAGRVAAGKVWNGAVIGVGVASFFVMGLGQLANKQRLKALIWFLIPLLFLGVEWTTSDWGRYIELRSGKVPSNLFVDAPAPAPANQPAAVQPAASSSDDLYGNPSSAATAPAASSGDDLYGSPEPAATSPAASSSDDLYGSPAPAATPPAASAPSSSSDDLYGSPSPAAPSTGAEQATTAPSSGSYFGQKYVFPDYAANSKGIAYPIRDFGGFFSKGIWGLVTLGALVIDDSYSGGNIELFNKISPWLSADNSVVLIGEGLIALMGLVLLVGMWIAGIVDAVSTRRRIIASGEAEKFGAWAGRVWQSLFAYIVSAPAFLAILFFTIIPFIFTFLLAFTNYNYRVKLGLHLIKWVGFDTFRFLALDPGWLLIFGKIFVWTIFWALMSSFTVYALGFANAMIVESPLVKGRKIWRAILVIPWALPQLIALMMFRNVFDKDGLMNQFLFASGLMQPVTNFLHAVGLEGKADVPIFWFQPIYNGALAKAIVILVNLWYGAPYHMMMIIGVLSTIPKDLYEAADIDGATGFQRFRSITLPMVLAATVPSLIMTFSFNFNNFGSIFFLTGGGPIWDPAQTPDSLKIISSALPGQTDILISWIYKLSFTKDFEMYNVASVYSIIIFALIGTYAVVNMVKTKSFNEEGGD
ncbi:MAG TPA: sugar ABC transporter permease [Rectinemataceae bacterium]|nr:sugar ABC transporter permease [Rectinemataceae bacterium]